MTSPVKKDPNAPVPTPLEKHLADAIGPVRSDGSDKFFGFENVGFAHAVVLGNMANSMRSTVLHGSPVPIRSHYEASH